jgi:TonB family protein
MNSVRILLVLCTLVPFSHAQTTPGPAESAAATTNQSSGVAKLNIPGTTTFKADKPVILAPKLVKQVDPEFPKKWRKDKSSGTVNVTMTVDEAGKPRDLRVDTPVGHGFDEAALKAIRQYRFEPATRDGKPVAVEMRVEVVFHRY